MKPPFFPAKVSISGLALALALALAFGAALAALVPFVAFSGAGASDAPWGDGHVTPTQPIHDTYSY